MGLFVLAVWPPLPHHLMVSEFASKDDLVEAAMASVHIPYFLDGHMTYVLARMHAEFTGLTQAASMFPRTGAASAPSAASTALWRRGETW